MFFFFFVFFCYILYTMLCTLNNAGELRKPVSSQPEGRGYHDFSVDVSVDITTLPYQT